ncbi:hypothetical protein CesoFtcFv8_015820 [Champsocephalus esox]|uniref:Uncharacterized protein n=1 Tax=Champsocephalus esox TaxID=159716 RepID=A0AAN8GPN0_9TELE|nr:hypothetical protein CesoFtcFv8_015820 [Champsocephalus esox]
MFIRGFKKIKAQTWALSHFSNSPPRLPSSTPILDSYPRYLVPPTGDASGGLRRGAEERGGEPRREEGSRGERRGAEEKGGEAAGG